MSVPLRAVDTHCHVDLYPDPTATLRNLSAAGLAVVAVTNTPSVFPHMRDFAAEHDCVYPALGLHPELALGRSSELALFDEYARTATFIGEVGLDGVSDDPRTREAQRRVFTSIVDTCRNIGGKFLTVHSRRAAAEVVEVIGPSFPGVVVLHWFSGSPAIAKEAVARGMFFSVNPSMVGANSGRAILAVVPRDRVLTETDGPFAKISGRAAVPDDVLSCFPGLASLWHVSPDEARQTTLDNFRDCLQRLGVV